MYFNVAQLLKEPTGATRQYDLVEDLSGLDPELQPLSPLVGTIQLLRTHSGLLVSGELSTALRITCNRCLGPIVMPVRFWLEEHFRPLTEVSTGRYIHPSEFEGSEEDLEDEALLINEQHILNLAEVVRQNIWLALPLYPTCEDAGLDECPNLEERLASMRYSRHNTKDGKTAGEQAIGYIKADNTRLGADEHADDDSAADAIDPRWAALLDLKTKLEERNAKDSDQYR